MAQRIDFYFDYLSPYAYLAWTQIHALAMDLDAYVEPRPVLLAALLNHHGQRGPAEIPAKRRYIMRDVLRTAAVLDEPLSPPPNHPFNPLLALRATLVEMSDEQRHALIDALFAAVWGGKGGAETPEQVAAIGAAVGIADLVERATSPDVKNTLRSESEAAIEAGVFGVPTMIVDGTELFWGLDSFVHLERYLTGDQALSEDALRAWDSIEATASR